MKSSRSSLRIPALLLAGLVLASLFLVPQVAAASCFSDTSGHWAESFICWMKTRNLTSGYPDGTFRPNNTISRAEVAVFMQKLITTGEVHIDTGPGNWVVNGGGATRYIDYYTDRSRFRTTTASATHYYQLSAVLPTSLLGQSMSLKGVKLCYDATSSAAINTIALRLYAGGASPSLMDEVEDATGRTDKSCLTLNLPIATQLYGTDQVVVFVIGYFPLATSYFDITSITFVLQPSTSLGVLDLERTDLGLPLELLSGEAP